MQHLITPDTRLHEALRLRPLIVEVLGKHGIDFWGALDKPISALFARGKAIAWDSFLEEIERLAVPADDCAWRELPVAHLLDFLTQNHRGFLLDFTTDIKYLLDMLALTELETEVDIRGLREEFDSFTEELRGEMGDEETLLYPRVLRYEACLMDPRVHPEFNHGSLQIHIASRTGRFSAFRKKAFGSLLTRARIVTATCPENPSATLLMQSLGEFESRLEAHETLEINVLFPMALEMERTLYNLSIDGAHFSSQHIRGPMDSGIMRLDSH